MPKPLPTSFQLPCIFLILCFLGSMPIKAQEHGHQNSYLQIHSNPLTIFGLERPNYQLGMEFARHNWGYQLNFGFGNTAMFGARHRKAPSYSQDYLYHSIRTELRYYFKPLSKGRSLYTALEAFYFTTTELKKNSYYDPLDSYELIGFSEANYVQHKNGLHLKLGIKRISFNRLSTDIYVGAGVAFHLIRYYNVENPYPYSPNAEEGIFDFTIRERELRQFNVSAGFKIGYLLWKNP